MIFFFLIAQLTLKEVKDMWLIGLKHLKKLELQTSVDLSKSPSGLYLLTIETAEYFWTERVVKM